MASLLRVMADVVDIADYAGGESAPAPLPILTLEQLREQAKTVSWLVKHAVPAESIGIMFGGSGTFKSFIALDLALHVAHGLSWLGRKTRKAPVLIVAAEGGSGLWRRIVAWHREHGLTWKTAQVYVLPIAVDLGNDAARVREAAAALGIEPGLVVVDTLSQTFSGEENSAGEVASYLRELGTWFRATWQAAVLVVHHTGHDATERPRGSTALRANTDFLLGVFRDEKEMLATVQFVKQKDGELLPDTTFALKVVDLANDDDGDAITSLVARALTSTGEVISHMRYESERGRGGRNHLFLEMAQNGMEEKQLRTIFCEVVDGDANAKRQAYFRAKKWVVAARLVEFAQGYVIRLEKS